MSNPSSALGALARAIESMDPSSAPTWAELHRVVLEATQDAENAEWQDYMGDDL